jgi:TonB family protein
MLWAMRPLMFLLFTSMALAQQGEDARPLLQQVADASRYVKSWRAEYVVTTETTGEGVQSKGETIIKEASKDANFLRRETTRAGTPILTVCDGANAWRYLPATKQHGKMLATTATCASTLNGWTRLLDGLQSAFVTGSDKVEFEGVATSCDVVRAEYGKLQSTIGRLWGTATSVTGTRTMCVDRNRSLILRDTIEAKAVPSASSPNVMRSTRTTTYSSIERDPVLPPDFFVFEPPADSTLAPSAQALGEPAESPPAPRVPPSPLPPGVNRVGNGVTAPALISKVEPAYTEEARSAKINGTVVLYIEVDPEGLPQNIRVLRSLEPGLDQNAIYAVSQWRFRPGMKDGNPVTVAAQVEVNFRFLQNPPPGMMLP